MFDEITNKFKVRSCWGENNLILAFYYFYSNVFARDEIHT